MPGYSELAKVWIWAGLFALEEGLTAREAAQAADLTLLQHVKKAEGLPSLLPRRKKWRWAEEGGEPAMIGRTIRLFDKPRRSAGSLPGSHKNKAPQNNGAQD